MQRLMKDLDLDRAKNPGAFKAKFDRREEDEDEEEGDIIDRCESPGWHTVVGFNENVSVLQPKNEVQDSTSTSPVLEDVMIWASTGHDRDEDMLLIKNSKFCTFIDQSSGAIVPGRGNLIVTYAVSYCDDFRGRSVRMGDPVLRDNHMAGGIPPCLVVHETVTNCVKTIIRVKVAVSCMIWMRTLKKRFVSDLSLSAPSFLGSSLGKDIPHRPSYAITPV